MTDKFIELVENDCRRVLVNVKQINEIELKDFGKSGCLISFYLKSGLGISFKPFCFASKEEAEAVYNKYKELLMGKSFSNDI